MIWSACATGKPSAVAKKITGDLEGIKGSDAEQGVKALVSLVVVTQLANYPPDLVVRVEVAASQWVPDHAKPNETVNNLLIKIERVSGFVT